MESKNAIKKLNRKTQKHRHVVTKETGVICSLTPTKNLALCNVGQVNGLNEETIVRNYHQFGGIERVILIPQKSCAFLSFKTVESATKAFEATHGILQIAQNERVVFLTYTESLPEVKLENQERPVGLTIIEDFITLEEELLFLSLGEFSEQGSMKYRQVKHFGYEFNYDTNNVDRSLPLLEKIPIECDMLWRRLPFEFAPDQLTINQYKPGQGIPPHIDTHSAFEDPILSLSLSSPIVMEFRKKGQTFSILLPTRSLLIMAGESRYTWQHSITPRKFDYYFDENNCICFKRQTRLSLTFRKVRHTPCDCPFKVLCDSQISSDLNAAPMLEEQHVHSVYNEIASHFSETRHKPWPNIVEFIKNLPNGTLLFDVGCGNGKYFGLSPNIIQIGTDSSLNLVSLCRDKNLEVFTSNCLNLPLRNSCADAVISIAVIHHLSTVGRRKRAIFEMARILRSGGQALIYVWAKQQIRNCEKSTYIKQDRKNRKGEVAVGNTDDCKLINGLALPIHTNRTDFSHSDVLVPWKLKHRNEAFLRFYHVFQENELEELCKEIEGIHVIKSYYDQGNYCCVFIKK